MSDARPRICFCSSYDRETGVMIWREAYLPVFAAGDVIKREGEVWWQVSPDGTRKPIEMVT